MIGRKNVATLEREGRMNWKSARQLKMIRLECDKYGIKDRARDSRFSRLRNSLREALGTVKPCSLLRTRY